MNARPISRCAVKACPVIGHWPEGGYCPMHADEADEARRRTAMLAWAAGADVAETP